MQESPVGSFLKFSIGLMVFISVSLGLTVAVNMYTQKKAQQQQVAAAFKAMLATSTR